jgi:hypothetical protein
MMRATKYAICSAMIAAFFVEAATAAPRFVRESEGKKNNSTITYTDLHITITTDTNINSVFGVVYDDGVFYQTPTITGQGTATVQIDWTGLSVPPGDSIGISVSFTLEEWNSYNITKQWTAGAQSYLTAALGLSVLGSGDYYLRNNYDHNIRYNNIEYLVAPSPYRTTDVAGTRTLAQEMEGYAQAGGYDPPWIPLPAGVVPAHNEVNVVGPPIAAGQYLMSYFTEEFEAGGTDSSYTIQEHEHQVNPFIPTVSEWGLIIMTLLLLTAGTIIFARHRKIATA